MKYSRVNKVVVVVIIPESRVMKIKVKKKYPQSKFKELQ